jgi:hypothetical protein
VNSGFLSAAQKLKSASISALNEFWVLSWVKKPSSFPRPRATYLGGNGGWFQFTSYFLTTDSLIKALGSLPEKTMRLTCCALYPFVRMIARTLDVLEEVNSHDLIIDERSYREPIASTNGFSSSVLLSILVLVLSSLFLRSLSSMKTGSDSAKFSSDEEPGRHDDRDGLTR